MNPLPAIKFIGAWACIVWAVATLIVAGQPTPAVAVLALLSIAFASAPATW